MALALAACTLPNVAAFNVVAPRPALPSMLRAPHATMADKWQDDPLFDPKKPDPIFDDETGYLGRVSYGFSNQAEKINGRAAMMGFSVAYVQEAITGKGVLTMYGLPYDEGAVVESGDGNLIISILGLVGAVAVVGGLTFAGDKAYRQAIDPDYDGTKLPFN